MFLSMCMHSCFSIHYNNSDAQKKSGQTRNSLFNASAICLYMASHLFHHYPGVDSARAHLRPEQHTLLSVFILNSFKSCQLNIQEPQDMNENLHAVRRSVKLKNHGFDQLVSQRN